MPDPHLPTDQATAAYPATALMLTGGGARAAYQVGVLEAWLICAGPVARSMNPTRFRLSAAPPPVP